MAITPGLNAWQATISAAANGATIPVPAGTYTFDTWAAIFDGGFTGTNYTSLTLVGADRDTVIVDVSGCPSDFLYGGNSIGIKIKNMTFTGTPGGGYIRDLVNSNYVGWELDNIKLDNSTKTFFLLGAGGTVGAGIKLKNIVTTATFGGDYVVRLLCPASDVDLYIDNIDARLNDGTVKKVLYIDDLRDGRIRNIYAYGWTENAIKLQSTVNTKGIQRVSITSVDADGAWDGASTAAPFATMQPAIHVGHSDNDNAKPTREVHLSKINVRNNASYGIEFENDCQYCSLVGFRVYNTQYEGVPLAEETQHITVSDGVIDTVRDANGNGLALVHAAYHKISRVTVKNCPHGIIHTDFERGGGSSGAYPEAALPNFALAGGWAVRNINNEISDCTIINCTYPFVVNEDSLADGAHTGASVESSANSGTWANNKVYGTFTAYALVIPHEDGTTPAAAAKTQAQFEALFPHTVKASDTVTTGDPNVNYSIQEAANILAGAPTRGTYTTQMALNVILSGASPPTTALSTKSALSQLTL